MEWDPTHHCLVRGPTAEAEADLLELGDRVAQELAYQPLLADDPADYA